jgi:hypothetical protein
VRYANMSRTMLMTTNAFGSEIHQGSLTAS